MTALLTTALKSLCGALNNLVSPAGVNWDCHGEKGAFFFHKLFQERREYTFIFCLEDTSCHNIKKVCVVNG